VSWDYYELRERALGERTDENQAVVLAILALAEQVQGLRRDLSGDDEISFFEKA